MTNTHETLKWEILFKPEYSATYILAVYDEDHREIVGYFNTPELAKYIVTIHNRNIGIEPADPNDRIQRLENGLRWLEQISALHYTCGALEPDHMFSIANLCSMILEGTDDLPDFDEVAKGITNAARAIAERLQAIAEGGEN